MPMVRTVCLVVLMLTAQGTWSQQPLMSRPEKPRQRSAAVLEEAKQWAQKGNWQAVRRELEPWVKRQPDDTAARKLLTEALLQLGEFSAALPHLRWLAQKLPNDPRLWATLGQVQERLGQLDEARTALRKAVHLRPDEPEFRVHLARTLIALDEWDAAAHHLRWLAHRVPDWASVQFHLALYYERKGDWRKALHHAKRTVRLSPKEPEGRLALARIALQMGDAKTAAEQVEALTHQFPTDGRLAMECAKLFAQANDAERAIRYFRRALHLQPDNADAHRALADLYSQHNAWAKALWHVRWLARRFPDDAEIVKAEAQCCARLRRYREAERSLQRWARLRPDDFEPFVHLARLYRDLGDGAKARVAYDDALKRRPPVEVIAEAAELEGQLGEFERAAQLYAWAQRRQPDNPQWRALRAEALMKARQFDRAGRILRSALKRFPDDMRLNALMGIWHAKRVEWVEAEPFLLRGLGQGVADKGKLTRGKGRKVEVSPSSSRAARFSSFVPSLDAAGVLVEIWLCQGRAKEAVRLCDELLRQQPSAEALIWWAQAMDELGKTKEAAQRLERSQMFARDERVAKATARLWELANEPERAARVWERWAQVVRDKRAKVAALAQAAQVWEHADQIPNALALLDKAQRIADEPPLQAERIRLMLKADAPAAALEEAEKLLAQLPDEPQAALLYAEAALRLWRDSAFERVAERWQRKAHLTGALLLIADRLNRRAEAEELLKTAAHQLSPSARRLMQRWLNGAPRAANPRPQVASPPDLFQRAQQAAGQNRIGEAMELCRKAIALQRNFLPAYELLLQMYQRQNDLAHAVKGFTLLANRYRDDLPLNFAAAIALQLSGQHRRAVAYWRRVCALTDNAPDAMVKLADSLLAARYDAQAAWCRRFVQRLTRWESDGDAHHPSAVSAADDRFAAGGN
ncbi:Beta-barrel assembly-enhancing protease [bacterium HR17]|uniref:Beta-barrel assembly-enhancing protease n=1 Tax=Candidatus Fervidibacter japonicus TaxID=2035412 RepID=A0A2H5XFB5_9BACT|nr:Beta-barrel assembly-enhancing protease [bacterium HR17]